MPTATLLGPDGQPMRKADLRREIATPTIGGVRPLYDDYPSQGLTPAKLGLILRDAVESDARPFLRLCEEMLEKDPHLLAVTNTRRWQVAQLDIGVEPAGDDQASLDQAAFVETWLGRDELTDELVDLLDAIVKGYSVCEIVWDTSAGQWWPAQLLWRDPAWFVFDRNDGRTLKLRTEADSYWGEPMPDAKFLVHIHKAKAGLPVRGGLGRCLAWIWLFKIFDLKSWVAFAEGYGQPLRLGKYGPGANDEEQATLLRAVRSLGRDMAAIIPDSMLVELVEAKTGGQVDLFDRLATFLDLQASKAVLGQTTTTDAVSGGHAVSKEHNQVREDIERADAKLLAQTMGLLTRWLVAFNFGPQPAYPRLRIGRPEQVDVPALVDAIAKLVPLGLKVGQDSVRDLLKLPPPENDDDVLGAPATPSDAGAGADPAAAAADDRTELAYSPSQPRHPSGSPVGGEWRKMGAFAPVGGLTYKEIDSAAKGLTVTDPPPPGKREYDAINNYVGPRYRTINGKLRTGADLDRDDRSVVDPIDQMLDRSRVDRDVVVFRGISDAAAAFYVTDPEDLPRLVGRTYREKGYASTSLDGGTAKRFAFSLAKDAQPVILEIRVPKGSKAAYLDPIMRKDPDKKTRAKRFKEAELLLPRGTNFRITGLRRSPTSKTAILEVEVVGD